MEYIGETHQALEQELNYQTYLEDELKNYVARVSAISFKFDFHSSISNDQSCILNLGPVFST